MKFLTVFLLLSGFSFQAQAQTRQTLHDYLLNIDYNMSQLQEEVEVCVQDWESKKNEKFYIPIPECGKNSLRDYRSRLGSMQEAQGRLEKTMDHRSPNSARYDHDKFWMDAISKHIDGRSGMISDSIDMLLKKLDEAIRSKRGY